MIRNLVFIAFLFVAGGSFAQEVVDDIIITSDGKTLTIKIDDPRAVKYDLLIYKTYEEIMINEYGITKNPITVDISKWDPAIYHIKVDYDLITQFRHYEVMDE
ncbi:MAG: hypothetical protein CVU11_13810 [Bacteroidetes bacterium HGW-Bacteroidetes-6]|jgi:hypothetical protein|nr:MAG: hypothetical protein CVU11_13810 [Bacteroidetes bacterium HGW-Bacteroidetes-6]